MYRGCCISAVDEFLTGLGEDEHVAIYAFDGREEIVPIAEFGISEGATVRRADRLGTFEGKDPSTNLNGAVVKAVEVLEEAKASSDVPLRFATLVIFTDGTDRAHRATSSDAVRAMRKHEIDRRPKSRRRWTKGSPANAVNARWWTTRNRSKNPARSRATTRRRPPTTSRLPNPTEPHLPRNG